MLHTHSPEPICRVCGFQATTHSDYFRKQQKSVQLILWGRKSLGTVQGLSLPAVNRVGSGLDLTRASSYLVTVSIICELPCSCVRVCREPASGSCWAQGTDFGWGWPVRGSQEQGARCPVGGVPRDPRSACTFLS